MGPWDSGGGCKMICSKHVGVLPSPPSLPRHSVTYRRFELRRPAPRRRRTARGDSLKLSLEGLDLFAELARSVVVALLDRSLLAGLLLRQLDLEHLGAERVSTG